MQTAASIQELQTLVRGLPQLRVQGGGSKPRLSRDANVSLEPLRGILDYEPSEYTITALAGTPIRDIEAALQEHGQFLPFDPPLGDRGATLGGTVAAGLSGPGRLRYGGLRDFLLGVRLVTGDGRVVFGGGKVVKNAAGFDIPKLMTGALGTLGVLAELTFKVFPRPAAYITVELRVDSLAESVSVLESMASSPLEPACLDLAPGRLWIRVGGRPEALRARRDRLCGGIRGDVRVLEGTEDRNFWHAAREFHWLETDDSLVRIPLSPRQVAPLEQRLSQLTVAVRRRYSVAGNVVWLGWPDDLPISKLEGICGGLRRRALLLTGRGTEAEVGPVTGRPFLERMIRVFDPEQKLQRRTAAASYR